MPEENDAFDREHRKLENDAWALYWLSEDLENVYREENDYWILQLVSGDLQPVIRIDDYINVDESHHPEETDVSVVLEDEQRDLHPISLLENLNPDLLLGRTYRTEDIGEVPRIGGYRLEEANLERIDGCYIAPDTGDLYRQEAEKAIERMTR